MAQYVIELPAVAELSDRQHLVETFWSQLAPHHQPLPQPALTQLAGHVWPGNFRELAGTLRALAAPHGPDDRMELTALPKFIGSVSPTPIPLHGELGTLTETAMRRAVDLHRGNLSAAARALGIDRSTFYRRLLWKD